MDGGMKKSLIRKSMEQFIVCTAVLLVLATPLFYLLTRNFYAEDMTDLIEAVQQGKPIPTLDLEADILQGTVLQFALITSVLVIAITVMLNVISRRLWLPFDRTLHEIEGFRLESGRVPCLPESGIREFDRLNKVLTQLMMDNADSYRMQKEFTENASHELQTPLAVFRSKLDMLLQQPGLTQEQASIIQELYQMNSRLARLNSNLLLLARMENKQYDTERVDVVAVANELLTAFASCAEGVKIERVFRVKEMYVRANRALLESMLNNLLVNAARHNHPNGLIQVSIMPGRLAIYNTSDEEALDASLIFRRFYRPDKQKAGNGLGLAIVKAVCDYHGWKVEYAYRSGIHQFTVCFA